MFASVDRRRVGMLAAWGSVGLLVLSGCSTKVAAADERSSAVRAAASLAEQLSGRFTKPAAAKAATTSPGRAEGPLMAEPEGPADYRKIADQSAYPPCDEPQKLSLEQLEAIAKLPPKSNKAGVQTHPAMVPLFRSMVLHYTGGHYRNEPIRFRLHVPEVLEPGKKYPMVVWLHGAGECGSDNIDQLSHLHHILPYLVGPKKRDFFLLVPQCPHSHVAWEAPEICWTTLRADGTVECHESADPVALGDAPISFSIVMTEAVEKQFPVDPNRVTVAGLSTGGDGTWRMLERRPDLFAAAAPIVSWNAIHEKSLREKPLLKKIPIWAIYSSDDRGIDFARREFDRVRQSGCHVRKTEFGVCGHRAWTPAMLQGDVFGWLVSRAKDNERFYAAEQPPTSPEQIGVFAEVAADAPVKRPTKAVARTTPAVEPVKPLLIQPTPGSPKTQETADAEQKDRERVARMRKREAVRKLFDPSVPPPAVRSLESRPVASFVDPIRLDLMARYLAAGEIEKSLAVADKIKNRRAVVEGLLRVDREEISRRLMSPPVLYPSGNEPVSDKIQKSPQYPGRTLLLDYVDRELDRAEQGRGAAYAPSPVSPKTADEKPLRPIPAGQRQASMDECGKEWAMSSTTQYGLFPNGWDQESTHVPDYIVNETGEQLRNRLARAFAQNDLPAMREFCDSFIQLDDIPLSSPWFDTSGGRLHGRLRYTLNAKAEPVVELLHAIANVRAGSKREFAELAQKSLKRINAIVGANDKK
ncbi:MAG: hypothetical protein ABFC77_09955 [Thermoguttaceae bacterium]